MTKPIRPTGPVPSPYMVIAERPGIVEARMGRVLCGPSGQELDRYLLNNTLIPREKVRCMNVVQDYRDDENPEEWEVVRDWPLVVAEVERVRPKYIALMGLWAARAFLGADIDLEWAHGLCFPLKWGMGEFQVMPLYHTAAGMHHPPTMGKIAWDFGEFGKMCRGEEMPMGHLTLNSAGWYKECRVPSPVPITAGVDTEGSREHPWCVSWSTEPGFGMVDRTMETEFTGLAVMHNAIHDLPLVHVQRFTDTMLAANLLGVEPLGLKSLARRHCGLKMRSYDDVVADARRQKALEYIAKVFDYAETHTEPTTQSAD